MGYDEQISWPTAVRRGLRLHGVSMFSTRETRLAQGARQRTSGRGQAWTLPGLRLWHQPASSDVLTHNVRPHVAKNQTFCAYCTVHPTRPPDAQSRRSDARIRRASVTRCRLRSLQLEARYPPFGAALSCGLWGPGPRITRSSNA